MTTEFNFWAEERRRFQVKHTYAAPLMGTSLFCSICRPFMMRTPGEISSQAHKLSFLLSLFVFSFSFFSRLKAQAGVPAIADKHVGAAASHASLKNLRCYRFGRTDSL